MQKALMNGNALSHSPSSQKPLNDLKIVKTVRLRVGMKIVLKSANSPNIKVFEDS